MLDRLNLEKKERKKEMKGLFEYVILQESDNAKEDPEILIEGRVFAHGEDRAVQEVILEQGDLIKMKGGLDKVNILVHNF